MKVAGTMIRRGEVEFFLRLHGMWEEIIALPPPPDPPYDIETVEPLAIPPQWGWTYEAEAPPAEWWSGVAPAWQAPELPLDEGWVLVLDGDPPPGDEWPIYYSD